MVPMVKAHWRTHHQHHYPQSPSQSLPIPGMTWLTLCGYRSGNGLSHVHFLCVFCSAAMRFILTTVPSSGLLWVHELHTVGHMQVKHATLCLACSVSATFLPRTQPLRHRF